ncbi:MAG: AI-2E family transporter [Bryobacteraceae bacterium]|nr:AI-2E family transporter [Bryobacteraceae bacterium]
MLGLDSKVARAAWTVLFIVALVGVVWLLREVLFLLTLALFFSYMVSPVVRFVEGWLTWRWGWAREVPLVLVYVLMLAGIVSAVSWVVGEALAQASGLAGKIPELVKNQDAWLRLPLPAWLEPARASVAEWARHLLEGGFEQFLPFLKTLSGQLLSGLGSVMPFLLVPVFAFFFLKDGRLLSDAILWRFPEDSRALMRAIFGDLHLLLSKYIRAVVLLSLSTFFCYEVFFLATGVPYSMLLSTLAAVLEFVPVVGPLSAGVTAALVAGLSGYDVTGLIVFLVVYRLFLDYVLQPWLMSEGIELHPLLVLVGILAGEHLAGISGMFLSIPTVAALRIVYLRLESRAREVVR